MLVSVASRQSSVIEFACCRGGGVIKTKSSAASFVSSAAKVPVQSFSKRRVGCVRSVRSVRVNVSVASGLSGVALASGPVLQGPKRVVHAALEKSRRAAADRKVQRLQQRFAGEDTARERASSSARWLRGVASSVFRRVALRPLSPVPLRRSELRHVESASVPGLRPLRRASTVECVMSRPSRVIAFPLESKRASELPKSALPESVLVASRVQVQVQSVASVGEWRPVGEALRGVLSQLASKKMVEASTAVNSPESMRVH